MEQAWSKLTRRIYRERTPPYRHGRPPAHVCARGDYGALIALKNCRKILNLLLEARAHFAAQQNRIQTKNKFKLVLNDNLMMVLKFIIIYFYSSKMYMFIQQIFFIVLEPN